MSPPTIKITPNKNTTNVGPEVSRVARVRAWTRAPASEPAMARPSPKPVTGAFESEFAVGSQLEFVGGRVSCAVKGVPGRLVGDQETAPMIDPSFRACLSRPTSADSQTCAR
jgi:hypothetical protein